MENQRKSTVSVCHGLELVPIELITRFARIGGEVLIKLNADTVKVPAIPGSLLVTSTTDNGVVGKRIEYGQIEDSPETIEALERLAQTRVVATYIDPRGHRRVCGSPDYPLRLTYQCQDGVIKVMVEGSDTRVDAFIN